eukprot:GEMP01011685.1.p1 GENE.GEMP01011685.1~~GEMP01011685.1.p1  ORF type:complete len:483 (+),score=68.25 GEMP01011685.1:36-1484(+)
MSTSRRWTEKGRSPSGIGIACANIASKKVNLHPFKIIGWLWFRSPLDINEFRNLLRDKLLFHRRFRSRVITSDFGCCGIGGKTCGMTRQWEEVDLDWDYHLSEVTFQTPRGSPAKDYHNEMNEFMGTVQDHAWDITKPLWRFIQIHNADSSGRSVMLTCIDHTIGDGVSQMQTLFSLMDDDDHEVEVGQLLSPPKREASRTFPWYTRLRIWTSGTCAAMFSPFLPGDHPNALKLEDIEHPSGKISVASTKQFALASFKELKNSLPGFTLNDVFMTLVTLSVYRYLEAKDDPMTKPGGPTRFNFQIMVDVMRRELTKPGPNEHVELQNAVAPMVYSLPFQVLRNPTRTYADVAAAVKEKIDYLKASPRPYYTHYFNKAFAAVTPQPFSSKIICNVAGKQTAIFSNVAGPQTEVKIAGVPVDEMSFNALFGFGVYFGLITYNGKLSANVTTDCEVVDDASVLMRYFEEEFQHFYDESLGAHGAK